MSKKEKKIVWHECPECEACFPASLIVEGKLPVHRFCGKPCPGSSSPVRYVAWVKAAADAKPKRFKVTGEAVPQYHAEEIEE